MPVVNSPFGKSLSFIQAASVIDDYKEPHNLPQNTIIYGGETLYLSLNNDLSNAPVCTLSSITPEIPSLVNPILLATSTP